MMAERNLNVDHVAIWRWVQRYAPEVNRRCRQELRTTNGSWRVDETYLRVAGKWSYLYRAVDSAFNTIDFLLAARRDAAAAKRFLQKGLHSPGHPRPRVINVDGNPTYPKVIAALKKAGELGRRCPCRPVRYLNNIVEIVFTQMTKPDLFAARMGGNYVTDLDFTVGHKDAVYQEFHHGAFLVKRGIGQTGVNSVAEILDR
jgi:transposase-like protein